MKLVVGVALQCLVPGNLRKHKLLKIPDTNAGIVPLHTVGSSTYFPFHLHFLLEAMLNIVLQTFVTVWVMFYSTSRAPVILT